MSGAHGREAVGPLVSELRTPQGGAAAALLLVATVVAFAPSLAGGFLWDDLSITGFSALRAPGGLAHVWFRPGEIPNEEHYWPLTYTSFWLEVQLFGMKPAAMRITNLLLHCANAFLAWGLLRRLRMGALAWPVAMLFAVHPMRVESVAWIIERKDVLSGLFYLAGLHCGLTWLEREAGGSDPRATETRVRRWPWIAGAGGCLVAGMLSKSVVFSLPIVFLLLALWRRGGRLSRGEWGGIAALQLAALLCLAIDYRWMTTNQFIFASGHGPLDRVILAGRVAWAYVGLTLLPTELLPLYPRWGDTVNPPAWQWAFPATALALPVALWAARRRIGAGPAVAVLAYAVLLGPMLGLVDFSFQRHTFIADRFTYLASIPLLALVLGPLFAALHGHGGKPAAPAIAKWVLTLALAAPLTLLTFRYSRVFTDDEVFYRTILAGNEGAWMARNNLGNILKDQGKSEEAAAQFEAALRLNPKLAEAHINLGELQSRLGNGEAAIQHLSRALELEPNSFEGRLNLGVALARARRMKEAIAVLQSALELRPDSADAACNLGNALVSDRRGAEGIPLLRRAVSLAPDDATVQLRGAIGLQQAGATDEARNAILRLEQLELARGNAAGVEQARQFRRRLDAGKPMAGGQ